MCLRNGGDSAVQPSHAEMVRESGPVVNGVLPAEDGCRRRRGRMFEEV
jgi:hypothetical protein